MVVDETSEAGFQREGPAKSQQLQLQFIDEMQRVAYRDDNVTIFPVRAQSNDDPSKLILSYVCVPAQTRGKFLPQIATKLGCNPKQHFRVLTEGKPVVLDDGKVVTPDMVTEKPLQTNACELVFLPDESYVESFIAHNTSFHDKLRTVDPERSFNAALVYHAADQSVLNNGLYRHEFLFKFADKVQHCFDNVNVNAEEYARPKALHHTQLVRSICPQITPLEPLQFTNVRQNAVF